MANSFWSKMIRADKPLVLAGLTGCLGISLSLAAFYYWRSISRNRSGNPAGTTVITNKVAGKEKSRSKLDNGSSSTQDFTTSSGFTVLTMTIPKESVGAVIGRQGATIKEIQASTKTRIDFSKDNKESSEKTVKIRGSEKGTQDAELKILHILYSSQSRETRTITVPRQSIGYIIGRGGETIRGIQSDSNCQIKVDPKDQPRPDNDSDSYVMLTGSDQEIASAASMLEELVNQYHAKAVNTKFGKELSRSGRYTVKKPANQLEQGSPLYSATLQQYKLDESDGFFECFVTAIKDPSHIWIQPLTKSSQRLEEINKILTDIYSNPSEFLDEANHETFPIGCAVAACSSDDDLWYRGKICEYSEDRTKVDVYFLDYGDSCWIDFRKDKIQLLRTEFYDLPGLAVECYTCVSQYPGCPSSWTDEDCNKFQTLCRCGTWGVIMAKLVVDTTPPTISLVDTSTDEDVDILEELLRSRNTPSGDQEVY